MSSPMLVQIAPTATGYGLAFGLAGVICLASIPRARQVEEPAVRRGLVWLLALSGAWAVSKFGFFVGPDGAQSALYTVGLVVGFGTVWAWLYFCSAYTGRNYHRDRTLRALGAGTFVAVVAVKLTNPIHGLYFSTTETATPFPYLAIEHGLFHWTVTGLSYVLAAVGLFMLFELYLESGYTTRPLGVLTVLMGVPVVLDIVAVSTERVIDVIYAPLGVAAFAVGVLFVFERRFLAVQATGQENDPAVFLDSQDRVRDYTPAAAQAFQELKGALGRPIEDVLPAVADISGGEERILESERGGKQRYFLTTASELELGDADGRVVMLSDVTTAERRRRELARHNQQLEEFASALTHELRNVIQIIDSRLAVARARMTEDGEPAVARESVERASEMTGRMSGLVDDFRSLARYGQTVEQLQSVAFASAIEDGWSQAETGEMDLTIEHTGEIDADPGRLRQLLLNAFEFARHNGADSVRVELLDSGFAFVDDGEAPSGDTAKYFAFGEAVPDAESGMKLPNVRAFARVHGWTVHIDEDYDGGTRLVVRDTSVREREPADATGSEPPAKGTQI